jgi:hypothetical protein
MAVGKLSSRTSLSDVVTGHVAVARGWLAEVIGQAANPCMAPVSGHSGSSGRVHRGPLRGPTDHGASVDDRG